MAEDLATLVNDPDFAALPQERQRALAARVDPELGKLPPERQNRLILRAAKDPYAFAERREGLPPGLLKATEGQESGGNPTLEAIDPKTGASPDMTFTHHTRRRISPRITRMTRMKARCASKERRAFVAP